MAADTIEIAALGRPLHPGTLYDCRNDTFIPGVSLWDQKDVKKALNVEPQPHTDVKFSVTDSLSEKTKLIDAAASLKLSFLAGLVEVGGSASYLNDRKSSMRQCRVIMKSNQTTEFKQLTMKQLGKMTYPEVFKNKNATHVVTAAKYGAEAYMVFERTVSEEEDKQEIKVSLEAMIKKIPKIGIDASGKVGITDEEKKKVEAFSCTFYGDFALEKNPATFEEAVLVYKQLPKLLGDDGSKAVPMKVWLYPLKNLNPEAAQLVREISVDLVSHVEDLISQLHEADQRAGDVFSRGEAIKVTAIKDKLVKFKNDLANTTKILQQNISKVLPAIRAGTEKQQKLVDILESHNDSPFNHEKMTKWLEDKESEIGVLEGYIKPLIEKKIEILPPGPELNKVLFDPEKEYVYVFSFTSLDYKEPYLLNMRDRKKALPWFKDPAISKRMRRAMEIVTKQLTKKHVVISYVPDTKKPGASVFEYRKGKLENSSWPDDSD